MSRPWRLGSPATKRPISWPWVGHCQGPGAPAGTGGGVRGGVAAGVDGVAAGGRGVPAGVEAPVLPAVAEPPLTGGFAGGAGVGPCRLPPVPATDRPAPRSRRRCPG